MFQWPNSKGVMVSLLSLTLLSTPSALAHGKGACHPDLEKFCKGVQEGHGERMKCLEYYAPQLSPACQAQLEERKARRRDCKADRERVCKNVQPGQGHIRQCMKEHQAELSPACQAHFQNKNLKTGV